MQALPLPLLPFGAYRQFIIYKLQPNAKNPNKTDKLPIDCYTGEMPPKGSGGAFNTSIWVDFETAAGLAPLYGENFGVGFVFTENDPFFFVDVDNCISLEGVYSEKALQILGYFPGCAVEISQSGQGLHIFGTGAPSEHGCGTPDFALGFYTESRFVALTGNVVGDGSAANSSIYTQAFIDNYLPAKTIQPSAFASTWDEPRADWNGPTDDAELLDLIARANPSTATAFGGKASFWDLWEGNADALARTYPSDTGDTWGRSEADAALAQHLCFWTGCHGARVERLMRASGLYRDKWDTHTAYLAEMTITHAIAIQRDVYSRPSITIPTAPDVPSVPSAPLAAGVAGAQYVEGMPILFGDQQMAHFAGCVYVLDRHEIFTPQFGLLKQGQFRAMFGGAQFVFDKENRKFVSDPWQVFTESQAVRFPKAVSTCFRPEVPPGATITEDHGATRVNTYKPLNTKRIEGDASPFLGLIGKLLPNERDQRILLSYLAAVLQYPGKKFQWWPVIQGTEGNGKTLIITAMRMAVGEPYCFAPNVSEIAKGGNKFNGWVEGKLFIAMEEIYVAERRTFLEEFKTTVTNDWLPIERKGVDQVMGDNRANGLMATNHLDGVPLTLDTRRYCIFFTAQQSKADKFRDGMEAGYFPDLYDWGNGEGKYAHLGRHYGWAVINDYLRKYPIDPQFNPAQGCQEAPHTSSTLQAVAVSLGGVEQAIVEAIGSGTVGMSGGWVSSHYLDVFLREHGLQAKAAVNKRREIMAAIGYEPHPGLPDGRCANFVTPDGKKPRLYVALDNPARSLTRSADIEAAYSAAQQTLEMERISASFKK